MSHSLLRPHRPWALSRGAVPVLLVLTAGITLGLGGFFHDLLPHTPDDDEDFGSCAVCKVYGPGFAPPEAGPAGIHPPAPTADVVPIGSDLDPTATPHGRKLPRAPPVLPV